MAGRGARGTCALRDATSGAGNGHPDPQGAAFAVYTPTRNEFGHDGGPRPGEFSWHELATTDSAAAIDFYTALFGWEKRGSFDMGGGWMYQMYGRAGIELGGMFDKTPEMPGPPAWLHYIMVDDVDDAADRVKAVGGRVISGPMDGSMFYVLSFPFPRPSA